MGTGHAAPRKTVQWSLLLYNSTTLFPGANDKELKTETQMLTQFRITLFMTAKRQKEPKCPSDESKPNDPPMHNGIPLNDQGIKF